MSVSLYPGWKEAVRVLVEEGLTFGDTVTKERIAELANVKPPAGTYADAKRYDIEVLRVTSEVKAALLTAHSMLLDANGNGAYQVVKPEDQTAVAVDKGTKALKREMVKMAMSAQFVRRDMLTDEQRKENADACAKIAFMAGMVEPVNVELRQIARLTDKGAA